MADPGFSGRTDRNGGFGAQQQAPAKRLAGPAPDDDVDDLKLARPCLKTLLGVSEGPFRGE
jgi:hypothetical protein